jgi:hypothetical protein
VFSGWCVGSLQVQSLQCKPSKQLKRPKKEVSVQHLPVCSALPCTLLIVVTPGGSTRHDISAPSADGHRCSPDDTKKGCALFLTEAAWRIQLGRQQMMKQLWILSCLHYCNCSSLPAVAFAQTYSAASDCCLQASPRCSSCSIIVAQ